MYLALTYRYSQPYFNFEKWQMQKIYLENIDINENYSENIIAVSWMLLINYINDSLGPNYTDAIFQY